MDKEQQIYIEVRGGAAYAIETKNTNKPTRFVICDWDNGDGLGSVDETVFSADIKKHEESYNAPDNVYIVCEKDVMDIAENPYNLNVEERQCIQENMEYIKNVIDPELNDHLVKVLGCAFSWFFDGN